MRLWRRPTFWVAVVAVGAVLLATMLTGCDRVGTPGQIHPTHADPNDDPFDTDDSHKKPSTVKTPAPKTSIIPGQRAPIRTTTRRR